MLRIFILAVAVCLAGHAQGFAPPGSASAVPQGLQLALCGGAPRLRAGVRGLRLCKEQEAGSDAEAPQASRRALVQAAGVAVLSGLARSGRRCVCVCVCARARTFARSVLGCQSRIVGGSAD